VTSTTVVSSAGSAAAAGAFAVFCRRAAGAIILKNVTQILTVHKLFQHLLLNQKFEALR
jgi:hypothetical protein